MEAHGQLASYLSDSKHYIGMKHAGNEIIIDLKYGTEYPFNTTVVIDTSTKKLTLKKKGAVIFDAGYDHIGLMEVFTSIDGLLKNLFKD